MNHWNLFKESWRIFWRNPALWLFGLLAALGGGFNLRYNFNFNFNPNNFDPESLGSLLQSRTGSGCAEMPFEIRALLNQIFSSQTFGTIVVIGIVWMIIAFLLVTYADGALMGMVNAIGGGQKASVGVRLPRRSQALSAAAGRALCAGAARADPGDHQRPSSSSQWSSTQLKTSARDSSSAAPSPPSPAWAR